MKAYKYQKGEIINNIEIIEILGFKSYTQSAVFKCNICGNNFESFITRVKNGYKTHCGCVTFKHRSAVNFKHGYSEKSEFGIWSNMKSRCFNEKNPAYHNYGGRGIKVCEEWLNENGFNNFINDMKERPSSKHSIDRLDNNGNYSKNNCTWATAKEQSLNRRQNRLITYNNITLPLCLMSDNYGLKSSVVSKRLKRGWSIEKSLTTPLITK